MASHSQQRPRPQVLHISQDPQPLSPYSTPTVPNSGWCSQDFMFGAGMVLIQRNTHKIVVIYDNHMKRWLLPRGRKDVGESIEQTAIREAYEETGYRSTFMPLYHPTNAPLAPSAGPRPALLCTTEPIFLTMRSWAPGRRATQAIFADNGGEYLTSWFVGQIEEDAVPDKDTHMVDEEGYVSHLCSIDDALQRIWGEELNVLKYAWAVYRFSLEAEAELAERRRPETAGRDTSVTDTQTETVQSI